MRTPHHAFVSQPSRAILVALSDWSAGLATAQTALPLRQSATASRPCPGATAIDASDPRSARAETRMTDADGKAAMPKPLMRWQKPAWKKERHALEKNALAGQTSPGGQSAPGALKMLHRPACGGEHTAPANAEYRRRPGGCGRTPPEPFTATALTCQKKRTVTGLSLQQALAPARQGEARWPVLRLGLQASRYLLPEGLPALRRSPGSPECTPPGRPAHTGVHRKWPTHSVHLCGSIS